MKSDLYTILRNKRISYEGHDSLILNNIGKKEIILTNWQSKNFGKKGLTLQLKFNVIEKFLKTSLNEWKDNLVIVFARIFNLIKSCLIAANNTINN